MRNAIKAPRSFFGSFGYNSPEDKDKLEKVYDKLVKHVHPDHNHHLEAGKAFESKWKLEI